MALTEPLVRDTYTKLKSKAAGYIRKGNIQKGLLYTHLAAYTNYAFWLSYHDDEIEQLLIKASKSIITRPYEAKDVVAGRCVLMDSLARYRGGLTVQYVKAIVAAGWELLYITEQELSASNHIELQAFLKQYPQIAIAEIPAKLKGAARLQFVYDKIIDFKAERVYLHAASSAVLYPVVCHVLPSVVQKFYIDMADHGFRMGMGSCDYNIQFRSLGCSIAVQKRGVGPDSILYLPFYPVMDNVEFKGLPEKCQGKVLILSGGIFWKIIDQEDTFFKLCKQVLANSPDAVILYPGGGDASFVECKLREYGLTERFILLGWRDDISELFRHCDLFLNTYPHGGGTMSLYAAHLKKPILSYVPQEGCSNPIEKFICQRGDMKVSSIGEEEFLSEAQRLISDADYRNAKAEQAYQCITPEETFKALFKEMSLTHKSIVPFKTDDAVGGTEKMTHKQIDYQNQQGEYQTRIVALAGLNTITLRGEFIKQFILKIIPKIKRVVTDRGFHFNRV